MHGIGNAPADRADKPFKCPFCSMSFKSKRGLQKHSEIKHDTEIEVEVENDIDMGTEVQTMEFIIASWLFHLFVCWTVLLDNMLKLMQIFLQKS